jgi:hypothetical protein
MGHSKLEATFEYWWMILAPANAPEYVKEYHFHSEREWRFDFAFPRLKVAVECDGGRWARGGGKHASPDDYLKIAHATALGWLVLRFSGDNLRDETAQCIQLVVKALVFRDPFFVPEPSARVRV